MAAFQAAAANADWSKVQNFAIDLNDQPGAASWPIESATFVLLPTDPKDANQSAAVKKFFDWGFAHGNDIATSCCTSRCRTACTTPSARPGRRKCRGRCDNRRLIVMAGADHRARPGDEPALYPMSTPLCPMRD